MSGGIQRSRYVLIGLGVLLMAALVIVVGQSLTGGQQPARVPVAAKPTPTLPSEAGMYAHAGTMDYAAMPREPNRKRTLAIYYSRRAAPGEAPFIPHPVAKDEDDDRRCLVCHGTGGWVPRFEAYTPVTPHPEQSGCSGCHEVQGKPAASPPPAPSRLRGAALPGSPPPIPHTLEMRENCLACHAGPGAVDELRTTHPERVSCRQCHVLGASRPEPFARPPDRGAR